MTSSDTPKDGDFAAFLERKAPPVQREVQAAADLLVEQAEPSGEQSLQDVLVNGEEPTDEFIKEFTLLSQAEPVSDEELERQALLHPGADGDVNTPE